MKKEIMYFIVPSIFLACVFFGAHKLYRTSLIMADNSLAIEKIDELISAIENGEKEVTQAVVLNFLIKLRTLKQLNADTWQSYAEAMNALRLASLVIVIVLFSFFFKQFLLLKKKQNGQ